MLWFDDVSTKTSQALEIFLSIFINITTLETEQTLQTLSNKLQCSRRFKRKKSYFSHLVRQLYEE